MKMDEHFKNEDFDQNIPVVLALLSIWYNNILWSRDGSYNSVYTILE